MKRKNSLNRSENPTSKHVSSQSVKRVFLLKTIAFNSEENPGEQFKLISVTQAS